MPDPIAVPGDLATFLGVDDINTARAFLLLCLAQDKCEGIVDPLPEKARGVVLAVAGRAYTNPTNYSAANEPGGFGLQYSTGVAGGLWLTKADKADLRRAAGKGTAFSIETLSQGTPCLQMVALTGTPTGGTFELASPWGSSTAIPFGADWATLQAILAAVPHFEGVTVTGASPQWMVKFPATLGPVPQLTVTSALTGGTSPQALTSLVQKGIYPPGYGLASWDYSRHHWDGAAL